MKSLQTEVSSPEDYGETTTVTTWRRERTTNERIEIARYLNMTIQTLTAALGVDEVMSLTKDRFEALFSSY